MGNNSSSSGRGHQDESVDFGSLAPQGVYTGPRDWNQTVVSQLICQRKLAPFYRPLEEYEDSWDDDQILAARKELPDPTDGAQSETTARIETPSPPASKPAHSRRPGSLKEPSKPEAAIYRGATECPICFLYYPPNINRSRCCDQAICTECFVQIKRNEPTTTHLVSEPAACPYCVQENFGVVYTPPPWRAGLGSDGAMMPWSESPKGTPSLSDSKAPTHKRRQKSFGHDSPEVVTTDQIRPDWEAKLAAVRAAVTRRANRRIIMRQVGDRLIPVGVTSGRVHAINPVEGQPEAENAGGRRSRRNRHQQPPQGFDQFLGSMGIGGQDLEELMIMEAMRLSLIDHEEQQRKEGEERKKKEAAEALQAGEASSDPARPSGPQAPSSANDSASINLSSSPSGSSSNNLAPSRTPQQQPSSQSTSNSRLNLAHSLSSSPVPPNNAPQHTSDLSAWSSRQSPPPFSTLAAALSATSAASAVLASRDSTPTLPASSGSGNGGSFGIHDSNSNTPIPVNVGSSTAGITQGEAEVKPNTASPSDASSNPLQTSSSQTFPSPDSDSVVSKEAKAQSSTSTSPAVASADEDNDTASEPNKTPAYQG
ncbi:hypothetical protein HGRIS_013239 [Hohenbuehelia grisea]|uniref:RING-type domain-containing protein n=1 Tax=Hohenbuehelia grisea TaxID=104357 RepID=A0ABR3IUU7_9AGAR